MMLTVGDLVSWRDAWGSKAAENRRVLRIEFNENGTPLDDIPWDKCGDRKVVVDLEGNKWAYGFQLSPIEP